jgi:hypothetical protein
VIVHKVNVRCVSVTDGLFNVSCCTCVLVIPSYSALRHRLSCLFPVGNFKYDVTYLVGAMMWNCGCWWYSNNTDDNDNDDTSPAVILCRSLLNIASFCSVCWLLWIDFSRNYYNINNRMRDCCASSCRNLCTFSLLYWLPLWNCTRRHTPRCDMVSGLKPCYRTQYYRQLAHDTLQSHRGLRQLNASDETAASWQGVSL